MSASIGRIQTDADYEIALLHEAHEALADIITPKLYKIAGPAGDQQIVFHTAEHFELFLVRLVELFSAGAPIGSQTRNVQLIEGLAWLAATHPAEAARCGLGEPVATLQSWAGEETDVEFWCGELGLQIKLRLSRRDIIWFAANCAKHGLLRLSVVLEKLERKLNANGVSVPPADIVAILPDLRQEATNRVEYHASYLVEMIGHVFVALNRIAWRRFKANPTNETRKMTMPVGVSSDVFRNLYGSFLVFKRYDEATRITTYIPETTRYLRMRF